MKHPLQTHTIRGFRWIIISLLLGLNTWLGVEAGGRGALVNEIAPYGIVSLELAATPERAAKIVESWDQKLLRDRNVPRRSVYMDFAFLVVYSNLLALCCLLAAEAWEWRSPGFARAGIALAWAQYAAALFDVIENCALLLMLPGSAQKVWEHSAPVSPWPQIALCFAVLKFLIVGAGILYVLSGLISYVVRIFKSERRAATEPDPEQGSEEQPSTV